LSVLFLFFIVVLYFFFYEDTYEAFFPENSFIVNNVVCENVYFLFNVGYLFFIV